MNQVAPAAGGLLGVIDRAYARLEDLFGIIAGAFIFLTMLFVVSEVVLRSVFNRPIFGFVDAIELGMGVFAFLSAAYCQRLGNHIRMDFVLTKMHGSVRWGAEALACLIALIVVGVLVESTWAHFSRGFEGGDTTPSAGYLTWPSRLMAPVGLAALWLRFLLQMIGFVRLMLQPEAQPVAIPPMADHQPTLLE